MQLNERISVGCEAKHMAQPSWITLLLNDNGNAADNFPLKTQNVE